MGHIEPPTSERQLRELGRLPKGRQVEAWRKAVETSPDGPPSGAHVASVVATLKTRTRRKHEPEEPEQPAQPDAAPEPPAAEGDSGGDPEDEVDLGDSESVSQLRAELRAALAERDRAISRAESLGRQLASEKARAAELEVKLETAEKRWQFLAAKTEKLQAELSSVRAHNARFSEPESTISGEAG